MDRRARGALDRDSRGLKTPVVASSRRGCRRAVAYCARMLGVLTDTLDVTLIHPDAVLPARSRAGDAGYDLRSVERVTIPPEGTRLIPTGVAIALPEGVAGLVTPRSGLALEHGLTLLNAPGLIDPNYRGEIKVILHNTAEHRYTVEIGDRVAQLLLTPYWAPDLQVVDQLEATERGASGFGSSGRR